MSASIEENMKAFLSAQEIAATRETMGVDQTLIGDHSPGRDDSLSDPKVDAVRIRAMYTHPDWARQGIGTYLLDIGEAAAKAYGFKTIELGSTLPGYPLYLARGYIEVSRSAEIAANGVENVNIKMSKML